MNNIRDTLHNFWSGFYNRSENLPEPLPLPAFQTGHVIFRDENGKPAKTPLFPYITYDVEKPDTLDFNIITANIWDRNTSNPGFTGIVDDVLAQISEKISVCGALLDVGLDGKIWLLRSNPFITYLDDPTDNSIFRGIVRVIMRNYTI